jgi:hypothetical protein
MLLLSFGSFTVVNPTTGIQPFASAKLPYFGPRVPCWCVGACEPGEAPAALADSLPFRLRTT